MSIRLGGVDLLGRTATTANGQFRDVELATANGDPALVAITIAGLADEAHTTIEVDGATVNRLALAAFADGIRRPGGLAPSSSRRTRSGCGWTGTRSPGR